MSQEALTLAIKNQNISEFDKHFPELNKLAVSRKDISSYFEYSLIDNLQQHSKNFFRHIFATAHNHTLFTELSIDNILKVTVEKLQKDKYDVIKATINDTKFYDRPPCALHSFYHPEFIKEFDNFIKYKKPSYNKLKIFILNNSTYIKPPFIDLIYKRFSDNEARETTSMALGRAITGNKHDSIDYFFNKAIIFSHVNDNTFISALKDNSPPLLKFSSHFTQCNVIKDLCEMLADAKCDGATYYLTIMSKYQIYENIDNALKEKKEIRIKKKI